jgi:pyruvate dehydrogenase E2 component (dihydrolipoamide acetyltransferase)
VAEELVMPRLSDTMEQGTVGRWLVHEGDAVKEGDVIAEIETDKATMEFQAYAAGTVLRILVGDGESAALGAPIAIIGEPGETLPDDAAQSAPEAATEGANDPAGDEQAAVRAAAKDAPAAEPEPAPAERPTRAAEPAPTGGAGNGHAGAVRVSPIARRMADRAGIDLAPLAGRGSGPDGRIVKVDVERLMERGGPPEPAAPASAAVPPTAESELRELSPMLKAVARRMSEAKAAVPHFYVSSEIDMTRAVGMRAELNEGLADLGEKISLNDLIVRSCALALMQHPQAHRSYVDGRHAYHPHANVGIAVALDDGLIVPVVREADTKSVRVIAAESRDLVQRARAGALKQREIEGGTFTVSNMGMLDVSAFSAIINPPESAILAVGATTERPAVVDGQILVRAMMTVTLACDHRACSGADGARLLQTVKRLLQAPSLLLA